MKVTFLGTAAGKPSKYRNVTSIAIEFYNSKYILIDCGEGTQRQIIKSKLKFGNLHSIYITHLHGDHIFGLPGLLATLNECRNTKLYLYGPIGLINYVNMINSGPYCNLKNYEIICNEYSNEYDMCNCIEYRDYCYNIEYCFVKHEIQCYAYSITSIRINKKVDIKRLQPIINKYENEIINLGYNPPNKIISDLKKGKKFKHLIFDDYILKEGNKKVLIILDNYDSKNTFKYFKNIDILIHECSYAHTDENSDELEKKARKHFHTTNRSGAIVASKLNAKKLIFTHFSNRYELNNMKMVEEEKIISDSKKYFNGDIICAYDFDIFEI